MDTRAIRNAYRPRQIQTLFVGESPPTNGRFFYCGSPMTGYTQKAFVAATGRSFDSTEAFLNFFREQGCWLVDLTEKSVDKMPAREGRVALGRSVPAFSRDLQSCQPEDIVIVLKKLEPLVREALEAARLDCPVHILPFHGNGWQNEYVRELTELLKER